MQICSIGNVVPGVRIRFYLVYGIETPETTILYHPTYYPHLPLYSTTPPPPAPPRPRTFKHHFI
jgi:hypothetical protein